MFQCTAFVRFRNDRAPGVQFFGVRDALKKEAKSLQTIVSGSMSESMLPGRAQFMRTSQSATPEAASLSVRMAYGAFGSKPNSSPAILQNAFCGCA